MLVVSLRGVRDGKSPYLPIQVSLRALLKEIYKKWRDVCFSMVYFRCQFKQDGLLVLAWATPILVSLRGLILIFRQASASLSNGSPLEFLRQVTGGFLWGRWRAVKPSFLFPVFSRGFSANEIFFTMRSPRSKKITKCASYSAWSESCVLIGYPSEQDWPVLPALVPWEKSYFYWPSLFCLDIVLVLYCVFIDWHLVSVNGNAKMNLANIQPSWPLAWSFVVSVHILYNLL